MESVVLKSKWLLGVFFGSFLFGILQADDLEPEQAEVPGVVSEVPS